MKRSAIFILILILGLSFLTKLYKIDRPLADWHSWRQADTTAVTRNYLQGIDVLRPTYDDLSNIPSGLDNPMGFRMVEFPFINATIAVLYNATKFSHSLSIHVFSRLVAVFFSLGSSAYLYSIVNKLVSRRTAIFSTFIYSILPFNLFFHTTTLPEIPLLFFSLAAVHFWISYSDKPNYFTLTAFTINAAAAMLLKPYFIFFVPALIYYYLSKRGAKGIKHLPVYLSALAVISPFILWRQWISQFPEGIPASDWLFNSTSIRFKGAFFRWLFAERIAKLIFGYWGLIPFGLGLVIKPNDKSGWFFHWWLLGMIAYMAIFATGNVTHDYYQIIIVPILAIFAGFGLTHLSSPKFGFSRITSLLLIIIISGFSFAFSWFEIRGNFNINNPAIVETGKAVDKLVPISAKVIAPYGGDTAFLYQTNRSGWPIGFEIQDKISMGATHYVSTSLDDETRSLSQHCNAIDKTETHTIIELSSCNFPQQ